MLESNDMVVVKTAMDLDLGHELLLGTGLCQRSLCNDLGGRHSLSLKVCEFITLSETSLAEELTAKVFLDTDVTVELDNFLFNNNLGGILLVLHGLSCLLGLLHCFYLSELVVRSYRALYFLIIRI